MSLRCAMMVIVPSSIWSWFHLSPSDHEKKLSRRDSRSILLDCFDFPSQSESFAGCGLTHKYLDLRLTQWHGDGVRNKGNEMEIDSTDTKTDLWWFNSSIDFNYFVWRTASQPAWCRCCWLMMVQNERRKEIKKSSNELTNDWVLPSWRKKEIVAIHLQLSINYVGLLSTDGTSFHFNLRIEKQLLLELMCSRCLVLIFSTNLCSAARIPYIYVVIRSGSHWTSNNPL